MSRFLMSGFALSLVWACGGGGQNAAKEEASADPGEAAGLHPCELLTTDEVGSVLPGHDGGFVAKSGGSLIEGVDSYQCSYSSDAGDLFTVIVHVAVDDARFEKIEPDPSTARMIHGDSFREVSVADRGWIAGDPDDMKLTAIHGRDVIELELMSANAGDEGDALAQLGSAIASRLE